MSALDKQDLPSKKQISDIVPATIANQGKAELSDVTVEIFEDEGFALLNSGYTIDNEEAKWADPDNAYYCEMKNNGGVSIRTEIGSESLLKECSLGDLDGVVGFGVIEIPEYRADEAYKGAIEDVPLIETGNTQSLYMRIVFDSDRNYGHEQKKELLNQLQNHLTEQYTSEEKIRSITWLESHEDERVPDILEA